MQKQIENEEERKSLMDLRSEGDKTASYGSYMIMNNSGLVDDTTIHVQQVPFKD